MPVDEIYSELVRKAALPTTGVLGSIPVTSMALYMNKTLIYECVIIFTTKNILFNGVELYITHGSSIQLNTTATSFQMLISIV